MSKSIKTRIKDLEKDKGGSERIVSVPSWGDYVYIDGVPVLKTEFEDDPNEREINLTWGEQ